MSGLLIAAALLIQAQLGNGVVTGVLRDAGGKPVVGVRVALAEVSDANPGSVLVSIATTDASGAYRLENAPQGRYHVVAGRIDRPTYYPGTLDLESAKVVSISSGLAVAGMDFAVTAESLQPAPVRSGRSFFVVGTNVLDLIRILPGYRPPQSGTPQLQPFSFAFESVNGQAVYFTMPAALGRLSYVCQGCSFLVWNGGVGENNPANPAGMLFHLKDGGKELEFTCQAAECKVETAPPAPARIFKRGEAGVISTSSEATFNVAP